jgi:hypothetical protein
MKSGEFLVFWLIYVNIFLGSSCELCQEKHAAINEKELEIASIRFDTV